MQVPLPELVRRHPSRTLRVAVRVPAPGVPPDVDHRLAQAAVELGLGEMRVEGRCRFRLELPWRTHVCGVVTVRLAEHATLTITSTGVDACLRLECLPLGTHDAHAAGAASVLAAAAAFGLATYPLAGLLPSATVAIGGIVWADATRTMAITALERRLEQVATVLADAVWPGAPPWPGGAAGVGDRLPSSQMP